MPSSRLIATGDGKDMVVREHIFDTIKNVFKLHGGVTIDTLVSPASILTSSYMILQTRGASYVPCATT